MIQGLRKLFVTRDQEHVSDNVVRLAAAVLLLDVAKSDYKWTFEEQESWLSELEKIFNLSQHEAALLRSEAEETHEDSVSLHNHIKIINDHMSMSDKLKLIQSMWFVAYADKELHHYEEHLIRRVSDMLHIPHREFIRTKHAAQDESR